jgi:alkyl sulfatase BDS1-like metallo-beta-lactamase superfamily hydrolase
MGGPDEVLRRARQSFDDGEYRWVAELVNHVVFADPSNTAARELQADALEQMGYQAESGTWRNAYLMGAQELRAGSPHGRAGRGRQIADAMTVEQVFDSVGVRFDPGAFESGPLSLNWTFTDLGERHVLGVAHAAIHHLADRHDPDARATVTGTRDDVLDVLTGAVDLSETALTVEGDVELFERFLDALTSPTVFPLVEPR